MGRLSKRAEAGKTNQLVAANRKAAKQADVALHSGMPATSSESTIKKKATEPQTEGATKSAIVKSRSSRRHMRRRRSLEKASEPPTCEAVKRTIVALDTLSPEKPSETVIQQLSNKEVAKGKKGKAKKLEPKAKVV